MILPLLFQPVIQGFRSYLGMKTRRWSLRKKAFQTFGDHKIPSIGSPFPRIYKYFYSELNSVGLQRDSGNVN
jgi:hypothetical protein